MDGNKPGASVAVLEADTGEDRQDLAVVLDVGLHDPDVEEDGEVPPVSGREDTGRGVGEEAGVGGRGRTEREVFLEDELHDNDGVGSGHRDLLGVLHMTPELAHLKSDASCFAPC